MLARPPSRFNHTNSRGSQVSRLAKLSWVAAAMALFPISSAAWAQEQPVVAEIRDGDHEIYRGTYGGDISAETVAPNCRGYVGEGPNFFMDLAFDTLVRINVTTDSGDDTTLIVTKNEQVACNDNAHADTDDPGLTRYFRAGQYVVYVGTLFPDVTGRFRILFSDAREMDHAVLVEDSSVTHYGVSGGQVNASNLGPGCVGAIGARPSQTILLEEPMWLNIEASSTSDLTLVVLADGQVWCNDDALGTLDPRLFDRFPSGLLRVFVGSHNSRVQANYVLRIQSLANTY